MAKKPIVKIELEPEKIRYGPKPRGGSFFDGSPKRKRTRSDAIRGDIDEGLEEYYADSESTEESS